MGRHRDLSFDLISDIHLDHWQSDFPLDNFKEADFLLIGGDLSNNTPRGREIASIFLEKMSRVYDHVVYIKGNHDFYGLVSGLDESYGDFPNVHYLNREIKEIGGVKFAGCMAWYEVGVGLNDLYAIPNAIEFSKREKAKDFDFLESLEDVDVLMTHVPLSFTAIHPSYYGNKLNKYFFHDREDLITKSFPSLYLCGHTHHKRGFKLSQTHCILYPVGYPHENRRQQMVYPRRWIFKSEGDKD